MTLAHSFDVVKEHSPSHTKSDIVHVWEFVMEFVIFTHFLVFIHVFQPAFVVIADMTRA